MAEEPLDELDARLGADCELGNPSERKLSQEFL